MAQNDLSVVTRIRTDKLDALETLLDTIGSDIAGNALVPFPQFDTLHFACWVVLKRDPQFPPCLILETNFDGPLDAHLDEWFQRATPGLNAVYSHCDGYPANGAANPAVLRDYLLTHRVESAAFYVGVSGQTRNSIRNALATRQEIECWLDTQQANPAFRSLSDADIYAQIQSLLRRRPADPPCPPSPTFRSIQARSRFNFALWIAFALLLSPVLLLFLLFYVPLVRAHETQDDASLGPPLQSVDPRLFDKEDVFIQNHLTTLTNIKPGKFRLRTLKGVLWIINKLARTVYIAGNLGGIPTIHFARWLLIDNDQRLLFFSNYDGSWASYLGDFVDKANYGLTSVWSNTVNFPTTHFLFFGGAQHIEAFKAWSRQSNECAAVWYSAYPDATVRNITDALDIRDGLRGVPSGAEIRDWLAKL